MSEDGPSEEGLSEVEHQEYLQATLPYDWIAEALIFASEEIAIDVADLLGQALGNGLPSDRLARIRMKNLLSALEERVGEQSS